MTAPYFFVHVFYTQVCIYADKGGYDLRGGRARPSSLPLKKGNTMPTMERLEIKVSITSPHITQAMKLALLLSIAKQLGVSNGQGIEQRRTNLDALVAHRNNG